MQAYRVSFLDARDGFPNEKILVASCVNDIYDYMHGLGHYVTKIENA